MTYVKEASPLEVGEWLANENALLIDVREDDEVLRASVPEARHQPLSRFEVNTMEGQKGRKVIFLCAHGVRSYQIGQYLLDNDILDEAYSVTGGIMAWASAGMRVEAAA
jgi:rhodanese-related sulfurtransferase